jgi:hypothetical protein
MFLLRDNQQGIKNELKNFLFNKLNINDSYLDKINQIVQNKDIVKELELEGVDSILELFNIEHKNTIIDLHKEWFEKLKSEFYNVEFASSIFNHKKNEIVQLQKVRDTYLFFGIKINYKGNKALFAIGFDKYSSKPYIGITYRSCSKSKNFNISAFVKTELDNYNLKESYRWYGYMADVELENVFNEYIEFYKVVSNKLNNN